MRVSGQCGQHKSKDFVMLYGRWLSVELRRNHSVDDVRRNARMSESINRPRRGMGYAAARIAATVAMGSWVVIGIVPVIVVISALV